VLYAPPSSSLAFWLHNSSDEETASPELCYYDDQTLERQRGRIVLSRSSELVDRVPMSHAELRHLFAIQSSGRTGSRRTYYLAASSHDELEAWVDSVRGVVKMYGLCGKNNNSQYVI